MFFIVCLVWFMGECSCWNWIVVNDCCMIDVLGIKIEEIFKVKRN